MKTSFPAHRKFVRMMRNLLRKKGFTQTEMTRRVGIKESHLNQIMGPKARIVPFLGTLLKILRAMECTDEETATMLAQAKRVRPAEPYEMGMLKKEGIRVGMLQPEYQRYYETLTRNLDAEPSLVLHVECFMGFLEYLRRDTANRREKGESVGRPGGRRALQTAQRDLGRLLRQYPGDRALCNDWTAIKRLLAAR
ncbi:MAG: helix-turn-helix domain-containing protein [Planctomycetota bacterium]